MSDDLIDRLKARCVYGDARLLLWKKHDPLSAEAAAEIYRLRAENERLHTIIDNLHAVEEKHRETANAQFHRANRLLAEIERLDRDTRRAAAPDASPAAMDRRM